MVIRKYSPRCASCNQLIIPDEVPTWNFFLLFLHYGEVGPVYIRWASPVRSWLLSLFSLVKSWFLYTRRQASLLAEILVWAAKISASLAENSHINSLALFAWLIGVLVLWFFICCIPCWSLWRKLFCFWSIL